MKKAVKSIFATDQFILRLGDFDPVLLIMPILFLSFMGEDSKIITILLYFQTFSKQLL